MTQHTQPREWRRDGENIVDDSVHSGHEIAVLKRGASVEDGDLIAAAPDLLAALITCQKALSNHWFSDNDGESYNNEDVIDADNLAKAAIRKATGETP